MNRKARRTAQFHHGMTKISRSRIQRKTRRNRTGGQR